MKARAAHLPVLVLLAFCPTAKDQGMSPEVFMHSHHQTTRIGSTSAAIALISASESPLTTSEDAPLLIMTEERADQIRKRNKAIEIRYSQSRRLSVMGREIEVCILLLPITGDLPKGTLLFKTATSATAGGRWGAVFNSRGLVEIEEILSHMPSKN